MISWPSKSTLQRLLDLAGLHCTTSERSGPFWQSMLHNFLSRPLSFHGWTTAMLFWLDFHQTQSTLYKGFRMQLVFNEPKRAHVIPLFISLHWLPVAARIQFKTLKVAYRTTTGSAPTYFHSLLQIYIPSRSLRSASERRLVDTITERLKITLQNILVHHSWLVEWSSHPYPEFGIPVNLQATTENSSLSTLLNILYKEKKNKQFLSLYVFLPLLASTYLNNAWDIYIYALSRRFYPKWLTGIQVIHFLSVCVFPGNWTHNLCTANAMLYHWATGTHTWCYEHILCLFASSRWISLCIPQL